MADTGSDHGTAVVKREAPVPSPGTAVVPSDAIENPGFPPYRPRVSDLDPVKERQNERRVSWLFLLSIAGSVFAVVAYIVFPIVPGDLGIRAASTTRSSALGIVLALFGIGFGAVHWSKSLMDGHDLVEMRHPTRGSEETRDKAVEVFHLGNKESGFTRRKLIRNTLIGALVVSPLPAVVLFRDLAPAGDPVDAAQAHAVGRGHAPDPRPGRHADQGLGRHPRLGLPRHPRGPQRARTRTSSRRRRRPPCCSCASSPATCTSPPEREDWNYNGHRRLLQDLHARRLPGRALRAADPPPAVPLPPIAVRHHPRGGGHLRPRQAPPAAAAHHRRRRGLSGRTQRLHRACRPELLGASAVTVEATKPTTTSSKPGGTRITTSDEEAVPPNAGMRFTNWGANYIDERTGISGLVRELGRKIFPDHWSFMLGEVALYSFVVILLSGTFLTFFFQASMAEVVYEGSYLPAQGPRHVGGDGVDARHQLRHPRRPADAAGAPLGGPAVRRLDRPAHAARVLHRRVPQAARAQLGRRLPALRPRDGRGIHRLLAPRRPALRQRPPHHRRHGQGHPDHRHLDLEPAVRRRVPGYAGGGHVLQPPHPAAARRSSWR